MAFTYHRVFAKVCGSIGAGSGGAFDVDPSAARISIDRSSFKCSATVLDGVARLALFPRRELSGMRLNLFGAGVVHFALCGVLDRHIPVLALISGEGDMCHTEVQYLITLRCDINGELFREFPKWNAART